MARKDDILKSFLEHEILEEKYGISKNELPKTVNDANLSREAIIKTIALIIDNKESHLPSDDKQLNRIISQYLNEAAI